MLRKRRALKKISSLKQELVPTNFIMTQAKGLIISNLLDMYCGKESGFGTRLSRQLYSGDMVETTYTPLSEIIAHQKKNITDIIEEAIDYINYNGLYKAKSDSFLDKVDKVKNLWWIIGGTFGLGLAAGVWIERLQIYK